MYGQLCNAFGILNWIGGQMFPPIDLRNRKSPVPNLKQKALEKNRTKNFPCRLHENQNNFVLNPSTWKKLVLLLWFLQISPSHLWETAFIGKKCCKSESVNALRKKNNNNYNSSIIQETFWKQHEVWTRMSNERKKNKNKNNSTRT